LWYNNGMQTPHPTRVVRVDPQQPDPRVIAEAAAILRAGGLVAFPTETVYGLGANALDTAAVDRIFHAKGRPASDPLIVHIAAHGDLAALAADPPPIAPALARRFWPGALTIVLKRQSHVPANLAAGRDTVALRMPAHPVALALIRAAGVPIAAPSANLFSRPSPTTARHVLDDLHGRIDMVLDAGPTMIGVESTVVDLTVEPPAVLRPGGVTLEALREALPNVTFVPRYQALEDASGMAAPGMLLKHYSPRAELRLYSGERAAALAQMRIAALALIEAGRSVGALLTDEDSAVFAALPVRVATLGAAGDADQIAARLFAALREVDATGVDVILARDVANEGLGLAIRDRLVRAAEGRVILVQ
jgi:L-threonylcarbamoyladenylate synthase